MIDNINISNIKFFDFLSFPHNPEELFTLLYIIEKNDNYEIYKAIHNETREIFAIKIIPLNNKISYQKLREESLIMNSLKNCENIIKYFGSYFSIKSKNLWLIYEYFPAGSVHDLLNAIERPLIEQEISIIINGILNALVYMHQLNIIHGNIKTTNILISENSMAKLGNFSKASQKLNNSLMASNKKSIIKKYDSKYDIFLLGIICIELFKGINNFDRNKFIDSIKKNNSKNNRVSTIKNIDKYFFSGKEQLCSKDFIDFLKKCLIINSYLRPSAFELKNHPFIKNSINSGNSEKIYFSNLIRYNIEKIEYAKKEKNYNSSPKSKTKTSIKSKKVETNQKEQNEFSHLYSSINTNSNKSKKVETNQKEQKEQNEFSHLYSSINSNSNKNSFINNNEKNSVNISNITNNKNNNTNNKTITVDKLAEFRMEQMKNEQVVEFDKYTDKDVLVDRSNIENSDFHYGTDNSFEKNVKASAVFGKGEITKNKKDNNKTYIKEKNTNFMEKIINAVKNKNEKSKKKENKIINTNNNNNNVNYNSNFKNNNINDKENFLIKKESTEIDYFKDNWDHLNKYKDIFQTKISDNNNNYEYNKHFLNLNSDDSFDNNIINNNNYKDNKNNNIFNNNNFYTKNSNNINDDYYNNKDINNNNYIPFSDSKCNIIQLGSSIKKYSTEKKSNYTSEYSLKNSIFKINENDDYSLKNSLNKTNENNLNLNSKNSINKSQKLLSSKNNNILNEYDINSKKSYIKGKFYKNDKSSTCFTSLNVPINKIKGVMGIISEIHFSLTPLYSVRQKNFKENDLNIKNGKKKENNNNKNQNILKKSVSEYKFGQAKTEQKPYLYKYIKELENKKEEKADKKKKAIVIKVKNIFNKENRNKLIKKSIKNIIIE